MAINYRYRARRGARAAHRLRLARASDIDLAGRDRRARQPRARDIEIITVDDGGAQTAGATRYADIIARGRSDARVAHPRRPTAPLHRRHHGAPKAVVWDLDTLLRGAPAVDLGTPRHRDADASSDEAVAIAVDPATPTLVTLPMSPLLHGTAQSTTMGTLALGGTDRAAGRARSLDVEEAYRLVVARTG